MEKARRTRQANIDGWTSKKRVKVSDTSLSSLSVQGSQYLQTCDAELSGRH